MLTVFTRELAPLIYFFVVVVVVLFAFLPLINRTICNANHLLNGDSITELIESCETDEYKKGYMRVCVKSVLGLGNYKKEKTREIKPNTIEFFFHVRWNKKLDSRVTIKKLFNIKKNVNK